MGPSAASVGVMFQTRSFTSFGERITHELVCTLTASGSSSIDSFGELRIFVAFTPDEYPSESLRTPITPAIALVAATAELEETHNKLFAEASTLAAVPPDGVCAA
ncbi:hypothetical protein D1007_33758 [Hordeum vulgare]|nr:hypothetical protein D1007_33758 [Hordeum vulgare]